MDGYRNRNRRRRHLRNCAVELARHLRDERGLSTHTIHNQCWHVQAFLNWLSEQGGGLAELRLEQVDAFLALKRERGWCRVSMASAASALRSFFRYAGEQGWCSVRLAAGIEGPRLFSHEALPVGPKWEDVQRLIASTDTNDHQDIRDRAILLLLAVYGLRSGEIVALTLDDVVWEQNILHVSRPKATTQAGLSARRRGRRGRSCDTCNRYARASVRAALFLTRAGPIPPAGRHEPALPGQ